MRNCFFVWMGLGLLVGAKPAQAVVARAPLPIVRVGPMGLAPVVGLQAPTIGSTLSPAASLQPAAGLLPQAPAPAAVPAEGLLGTLGQGVEAISAAAAKGDNGAVSAGLGRLFGDAAAPAAEVAAMQGLDAALASSGISLPAHASPYAKLEKLFEQGVTPEQEELLGWHVGRAYYPKTPMQPYYSLLAGMELGPDGGPLFGRSLRLVSGDYTQDITQSPEWLARTQATFEEHAYVHDAVVYGEKGASYGVSSANRYLGEGVASIHSEVRRVGEFMVVKDIVKALKGYEPGEQVAYSYYYAKLPIPVRALPGSKVQDMHNADLGEYLKGRGLDQVRFHVAKIDGYERLTMTVIASQEGFASILKETYDALSQAMENPRLSWLRGAVWSIYRYEGGHEQAHYGKVVPPDVTEVGSKDVEDVLGQVKYGNTVKVYIPEEGTGWHRVIDLSKETVFRQVRHHGWKLYRKWMKTSNLATYEILVVAPAQWARDVESAR